MSRYLLAGGGTAGHVNPLLAIASELRRRDPDAELLFCGTERGIEKDIISHAGYRFEPIRARGLPYKPSAEMVRAIADFMAGRRACRGIIRTFKPDAVIGTGGYVCSPVVAAASALRVPILLHEQNAYPGRSNRIMARRSQAVCISFPGAEKWFAPNIPITLTGNPIREEFFSADPEQSRQELALKAQEPFVVAMGASLGARSINQAVLGWMRLLRDAGQTPPRVLLIAGRRTYAETAAAAAGMTGLEVRDYLHDVSRYLSAADLLIMRAGASSCMEAAALGKATIFVPYPFAAGDHQTYNARTFADRGAGILCPDAEFSPAWLAQTAGSLLADPARRLALGEAARALARPDAAAAIVDQLQAIVRS